MNESKIRKLIFIFACGSRILSAILTVFTTVNPESTSDAVYFTHEIKAMALQIQYGNVSELILASDLDTRVLFLTPVWLIPGPGIIYIHLANSLFSILFIYNVYYIAAWYHSNKAGLTAIIPIIVYPSFIAVHTAILREVFILFTLTTALRLVLTNAGQYRKTIYYLFAILFLYFAYFPRRIAGPVYGISVMIGTVVYLMRRIKLSRDIIGVVFVLVITSLSITDKLYGILIYSLSVVRNGIDFLGQTRMLRASGRTVYLTDIIPETILQTIGFSWIAVITFLYTPFPWMVSELPDIIIMIEGIITIVFTILSISGAKIAYNRNPSITMIMCSYVCIGSALFALGTVNWGTAMRHRQLFTWVIFVFGGIGFAERVGLKLND
jgi:hypothetical protein